MPPRVAPPARVAAPPAPVQAAVRPSAEMPGADSDEEHEDLLGQESDEANEEDEEEEGNGALRERKEKRLRRKRSSREGGDLRLRIETCQ